jgi:hypothetical protein
VGTDQENRSPRRNALRHGIYSNELCFRGEVLDKRSADSARFCRRYRQALQRKDDFEAGLGADLARCMGKQTQRA